jgi:signal peptidase II
VTGLLASGATLLLLDQWSKRTVQLLRPRRFVAGVPFLYIRHVANINKIYRSGRARAAFVLVWLVAFASAIVLHRSGLWFHGQVSQIGLGLAFGGAAGNLLDIVRHQSVTDFIDVRWWPVFNIADIGIVGGLLLAFWR